jgi:hypothetical protein
MPQRMRSLCPFSETKTSSKPAHTVRKRYEYKGVPQEVRRSPLAFDCLSVWMTNWWIRWLTDSRVYSHLHTSHATVNTSNNDSNKKLKTYRILMSVPDDLIMAEETSV